jgi:hypothetical protein
VDYHIIIETGPELEKLIDLARINWIKRFVGEKEK